MKNTPTASINDTFGELLRAKRKLFKFSYAKLSKKLSLSPSMLFNYECGAFFPREDSLPRICEFLGRPTDEIRSLISKEKNHNLMENTKYPEMRKIILASYSVELLPSDKVRLSHNQLLNDFINQKIHPIEEKLISFVNEGLRKVKLLGNKEEIQTDSIPEAKKEFLFKKVIQSWGYDAMERILVIEHFVGKASPYAQKHFHQKFLYGRAYYKMEYAWVPYAIHHSYLDQ